MKYTKLYLKRKSDYWKKKYEKFVKYGKPVNWEELSTNDKAMKEYGIAYRKCFYWIRLYNEACRP